MVNKTNNEQAKLFVNPIIINLQISIFVS